MHTDVSQVIVQCKTSYDKLPRWERKRCPPPRRDTLWRRRRRRSWNAHVGAVGKMAGNNFEPLESEKHHSVEEVSEKTGVSRKCCFAALHFFAFKNIPRPIYEFFKYYLLHLVFLLCPFFSTPTAHSPISDRHLVIVAVASVLGGDYFVVGNWIAMRNQSCQSSFGHWIRPNSKETLNSWDSIL